jgi:hypothetical protein
VAEHLIGGGVDDQHHVVSHSSLRRHAREKLIAPLDGPGNYWPPSV